MTTEVQEVHLAGAAFDAIADSYDTLFTSSVIGRAQRSQVWKKAHSVFGPGDHVLELNCGTGEDALFLTSRGASVLACDASPRMIEQARSRLATADSAAPVSFHVLPIEQLDELSSGRPINGVFSNFSGLNCVADLKQPAHQLYRLLSPGAHLLLCFSTRYCAWEILSHAVRLDFGKAIRRCRGSATVIVCEHAFPIYYPTVRAILKSFGPGFRLRSITGIGVTVPPSYLEGWANKHLRLFRFFEVADRILGRVLGVRVLGDHMLLHLERI